MKNSLEIKYDFFKTILQVQNIMILFPFCKILNVQVLFMFHFQKHVVAYKHRDKHLPIQDVLQKKMDFFYNTSFLNWDVFRQFTSYLGKTMFFHLDKNVIIYGSPHSSEASLIIKYLGN